MIIIGCDYHPGSNRLRLSIRTLVASTLNILESEIRLNLLLIATNPRDRFDSRYPLDLDCCCVDLRSSPADPVKRFRSTATSAAIPVRSAGSKSGANREE